ncbi:pentatricopeptide repeat-containing protein At2g39620-like [Wolffia australiana]
MPLRRPLSRSLCTAAASRGSVLGRDFRRQPSAIDPLPVLRSRPGAGRLRAAHALVTVLGLLSNAASLLATCYASLGLLSPAETLLYSTADAGIRAWNAMIRAYSNAGCPADALRCFSALLRCGPHPDKYTFPLALRACAAAGDAATGEFIHSKAARRGLDADVYVRTALVDMYAKKGMLGIARELFETMPQRDVVSWNALISGFARSGDPRASLALLSRMSSSAGVPPNSITLLSLFPAISDLSDVFTCRAAHGFAVRRRWASSVGNGLIDTYCKCASVWDARRVFDGMSSASRDAVSWASMISGYVNNGLFAEALDLFDRMSEGEAEPNQVSVVAALMAASETRDVTRGEEIHAFARREGIDTRVAVATALATMYAKCGDYAEARRLFDGMEDKDVVAWSAAISASTQAGQPAAALSLFAEMRSSGVEPNRVTLLSLLPACAQMEDGRPGKAAHGFALRAGLGGDASVLCAVVAAYAKLGLFPSARALLDAVPCCEDVVAWNSLINAYAHKGDACAAVEAFRRMRRMGVLPDPGTMVGVLPACSLLNDRGGGASAHALVVKSGLGFDSHAQNALVDLYAKCGDFAAAESLFRAAVAGADDTILWNTMMAGYSQNGRCLEAVSLFCEMRRRGNLKPDVVTFVSVLPAVAYLAALRAGTALHGAAVKGGVESQAAVGNSLIDMYSKCGRVDLAGELFDRMGPKDVVSWNAMISGLAAHGQGEAAVRLFGRMREAGVEPDSLSLLAALSGCRHGGLVEEGRRIFSECAGGRPGPKVEHYACLVDLLGRAGRLDEAWGLVRAMPMEPDAAVWGALLGACRTHSNARLGEEALENLVRLEPRNAAHHVVLSNIYAQLGRWADARRARARVGRAGLSKTPGCSWVEVKNRVHAFRAGDRSHPQYASMSRLWDDLRRRMEAMGYVADASAALQNVEDEEKASFLDAHSERLALSFALVSTEPGVTIHVVKNLRVCGDCHAVTKLISIITARRIIVRDASRFHHFENGVCSCRDFW